MSKKLPLRTADLVSWHRAERSAILLSFPKLLSGKHLLCSWHQGKLYCSLEDDHKKRGLYIGSARDIRFSLTGSINWARRLARVEATLNTIQGYQAIADTVMEKKMKPGGPGHPQGMGKAI